VNAESVLLDTNIFIAARDTAESEAAACNKLIEAIDDGKFRALVSVVTLAELRAGFDEGQLAAYWTPFLSHLVASPNYTVEPIDQDVALLSGAIRQELHLSLPDCLILATAALRNAACVVTLDRGLRKGRGFAQSRAPSDLLR
jgi:predicted nucleic acid-binding protein